MPVPGPTRDPKPATGPGWDDYWTTVGNEDYLVARELIELSPSVRAHFAGFVGWHDEPCLVDDPDDPGWSIPDPSGLVTRYPELDWRAAAAAADEWPASSTERRLLALVLSIVNPDEEHGSETHFDEDEGGYYSVPVTTGTRTLDVRDLSRMGSWAYQVAAILTRYITGQPPAGVRSHG